MSKLITAKAIGLTTIVTATGTKRMAVFTDESGNRYTARPVAGLVRGKEVTLMSNDVTYPATPRKRAETKTFWEVIEDFNDAPEVPAHDEFPA